MLEKHQEGSEACKSIAVAAGADIAAPACAPASSPAPARVLEAFGLSCMGLRDQGHAIDSPLASCRAASGLAFAGSGTQQPLVWCCKLPAHIGSCSPGDTSGTLEKHQEGSQAEDRALQKTKAERLKSTKKDQKLA